MTPATILLAVLALCSAVLVVGVWWPPGDSLEEHIAQALDLTRPAPRGPDDDPAALAQISEQAHRMADDA
jgi:hypothetical protein